MHSHIGSIISIDHARLYPANVLALANEVIASRAFLAAHEQEPDYYVVLDSDIPYDVFQDEDRANICAADVNGLFSLQKVLHPPCASPCGAGISTGMDER